MLLLRSFVMVVNAALLLHDPGHNPTRTPVQDSIRHLVQDTMRAPVRDTIRQSVSDTLRDSVRHSVQDSVRDTVHGPVPKSYVLIVAGPGGEPEFVEAFYATGRRLATAMHVRQGIPDSMIVFLTENPSRAGAKSQGPSTKVEVEKAFARITAKAAPGDLVFIVLIGHGANQDGVSRFNLKGPDMSAEDFAALLTPLSAQRVVFVNASSASSEYIKALSGKNRVIITATKTPMERNAVTFGKHFAAAYDDVNAGPKADGHPTLLQVFQSVHKHIVEDANKNSNAFAEGVVTEHALLDDNGDGVGTEEPTTKTPDGPLAAAVIFPKEKAK